MTHYITTLLEDANNLTESLGLEIEWTDHSYANDACPSIGFDLDDTGDNYVQLFAFETKEDAVIELGEEHATLYSITVCRDGEHDYTSWDGDSRSEALSVALHKALEVSVSKLVMSKFFDDLDALCLFVQNSIGLTDGSNAAMFWSGYEDGIQELVSQTKSKNVLDSIPDDILLEYVQSEVNFAMQQKHAKNS